MFSNKQNINILTALLTAHGISDAVVCPGSRNAPIVHNLSVCRSMRCWPVTDERSAGFCAIGIAQATQKPVVVCVTSGSALLNLAPAVAEAQQQHIPLIVVSADRPQQWIGQLDGQTLPQPPALLPFVRKAVSLPEPHDAETRWLCNRLVNEALFQAGAHGFAPVHINVPISEPLFCFDTPALPCERTFRSLQHPYTLGTPTQLIDEIRRSHRPIIVIGQMPEDAIGTATMEAVANSFALFCEPLGGNMGKAIHFDEVIRASRRHDTLLPDLIIYVGDTLVSKCARQFLRKSNAKTFLITTDASATPDPTMRLEGVVECTSNADIGSLLMSIAKGFSHDADTDRRQFCALWRKHLDTAARHAAEFCPDFSQMAVVKCLESRLSGTRSAVCTHYANSTAIRLAAIYANHYVWCNRGVNGIEGSVSAAAGFSLATQKMVICVTGDLSFFYDQNALWNRNIDSRLRIVLLNNGGGGIFRQLGGLQNSPAAEDFIEAAHTTNAKGICLQNGVEYAAAHDMAEAQSGIARLLGHNGTRPMLLEVFTSAATDAATLKEYYNTLCLDDE